MIYLKRGCNLFLLMLFANIVLVIDTISILLLPKVLLCIGLFGYYIYYNVRPRKSTLPSLRMRTLLGGYELGWLGSMCLFAQTIFVFYLCFVAKGDISTGIFVTNTIVSIIGIGLLLANGCIRMFVTSTQLGASLRLWLLLLWWVPILNIVLFLKTCHIAWLEYTYEYKKKIRNDQRAMEKICQTKYPILMVHGIFFRDWKPFGYWGRIPEDLIQNGAVVHYGKQQSSSSIEQSANELQRRILEILQETGAEKLNVIAHSKGGLDMRYALSHLGIGDKVASLTTVNTPHLGCNFAGKLIQIAPEKFILSVGKKYEGLFQKLGDEKPDFFSGVNDLTAEKCAILNKEMPDVEGVLYQSVGSKMGSSGSALFPLNLGYRIIYPIDGDNDGLVAVKSMAWGDYLGTVVPEGKMGISHGDMIDLTRKNIKGFDVCEFYVQLVRRLKEKGL